VFFIWLKNIQFNRLRIYQGFWPLPPTLYTDLSTDAVGNCFSHEGMPAEGRLSDINIGLEGQRGVKWPSPDCSSHCSDC